MPSSSLLPSSEPVPASAALNVNGKGRSNSHPKSTLSDDGLHSMDSRQYQKELASFIADDDDDNDDEDDCDRDDHDHPSGHGEEGNDSFDTVNHRNSDIRAIDGASDAENGGDDDNDETFVYTGNDSPVSLDPAGDEDSDSYSAKMREILGSDDDDDDDDDYHQRAETERDDRHSDKSGAGEPGRGEDESFQFPGTVPQDVSYDTRAISNGTSGRGSAAQRPSTTPDTPRSLSAGWSSMRVPVLPTPQRPAAYPSISRLRSSLSSAAASSALRGRGAAPLSALSIGSPGSSSRYQRSPLPFDFVSPSASTSQGPFGVAPTPPSISSARSRNSSFSFQGSMLAGERRKRKGRTSFPYGPSGDDPSAGQRRADATVRGTERERQSLQSEAALTDAWPNEDRSAETSAWKGRHVLKETRQEDGEMKRDFVRWSALRKISSQLASGLGADSKANGNSQPPRSIPSVLAVAGGLIAIGTDSGRSVVFDFAQDLKCICDSGSITGPPGSVTALAFSSDHTYLGVGHETGHIFLYDLSSPSRPSRHVPPVPLSAVKAGKKEGHLNGSKIVQIGFVGLRHTAIVTADSNGLSFYHALGKILGVSSNDTLRLLGRYPQHEREYELGLSRSKPNAVFGMAPLPLGSRPHVADEHHFIAILTSAKLVLVGLKPSARTWYRKVRPKRTGVAGNGTPSESQINDKPTAAELVVPGCLAWYPASTEADGRRSRQTNPVLAFSFGDRLHLLRLLSHKAESGTRDGSNGSAPHADARLLDSAEEIEVVELTGRDGLKEKEDILTMQWLSPDLLMLVMKGGLALFDCRSGTVTERMEGDSAAAVVQRLVEHPWFNPVLDLDQNTRSSTAGHSSVPDSEGQELEPAKPRSWAVSHSVRTSKGKTFFLTTTGLLVGSLLSWADRLLAYVSEGDFLSAIELATFFYQDQALGSAMGLPSDPDDRRNVTGQKLRELMAASTEYAFSPDRLIDTTHVTADGRGVDRTPLFEGLARCCARACLALGDIGFLFDVLYDRYEDNGIEGIFVGQMEQFIVSGELRSLPIPVVQRLLAFRKRQAEYELAEKIIWHVDPKSLDLDQALSLCIDQKLYDAMIYVYNSALEDFVSPIIELLVPLKRILQVRRRVLARLRQTKRRQRAQAAEAIGVADPLDEGSSTRSAALSQPSSFDAALVDSEEGDEQEFEDAYKIFSYLSVILTGHQYPSQDPIASQALSNLAKTTIYSFVFSGRCMLWPPGPGGKLVLFGLEDDDDDDMAENPSDGRGGRVASEPIYPYLRLFLEFDAEAFLDALDLAFEDPFLDDEELVGKRISRQLIIDILLELSRRGLQGPVAPRRNHGSDDGQQDPEQDPHDQPALPSLSRAFVNIFVARNAPKYPQFIKLAQADVDQLLRALARPDLETEDVSNGEISVTATTREDRQLATEYLLSTYKPVYDEERLDDFEQAGFVRILQSAFRQTGNWDRLLAMLIRESIEGSGSADGIVSCRGQSRQAFAHIEEVVVRASRSQDRARMMPRLHELLVKSIEHLLEADSLKTVALLDRFFPNQHVTVVQVLRQKDRTLLLRFLKCFFEPLQVLSELRRPEETTSMDPSSGEALLGDAVEPNVTVAVDARFQDRYDEQPIIASPDHLDEESRDLFIDLLSRLEPDGIVRNLDARGAHFFDLETVIALCQREEVAAGDAVLWCLDRLGRAKEAFDELDRILAGSATGLVDLVLEERQRVNVTSQEGVLLDEVRKAVNMAVRLCIEKANNYSGKHDSDDEDAIPVSPTKTTSRPQPIDTDEIWFRLLRSLVKLVHDVATFSPTATAHVDGDPAHQHMSRILAGSREIVQETLSKLIASTAAEAVSFPDLFRRLVGDGNAQKGEEPLAKYYAEVRAVLEGMLGAYKLRSDLLQITNNLFDRDTFNQFRRLTVQRRRGWRPASGQARCSSCGLVVLGQKRGFEAREARSTQAADGIHRSLHAAGLRSFDASNAGNQPMSPALSRRSSRDVNGGNLRRRVLRNNSSSSLSIPQTPLRRRPMTPYDEKAAPLSSPSIDKGKGVIRNTGEGSQSEIDDYFSGPASMLGGQSSSHLERMPWKMAPSFSADSFMLRSNSSSSSFSLRIEDQSGRGTSPNTPNRTRSSSTGTRSSPHTPRRQMSEGLVAGYEGEADGSRAANVGRAGDSEEEDQEEADLEAAFAESKLNDAIVVLRSGEVYHQSCFHR